MKEEVGGKLQDIKNIMKYAKNNFLTEEDLEKIRKTSKKMKEVF